MRRTARGDRQAWSGLLTPACVPHADEFIPLSLSLYRRQQISRRAEALDQRSVARAADEAAAYDQMSLMSGRSSSGDRRSSANDVTTRRLQEVG